MRAVYQLSLKHGSLGFESTEALFGFELTLLSDCWIVTLTLSETNSANDHLELS